MKKIYLIGCFIVVCLTGWSQQYFITNQYVYDLFLVNPAAAGINKNCTEINGLYQKQWFGMDQAPTTQIVTFETGVNNQLGSGSYIYNDRNGFYKRMGLQQSFSYEVLLNKKKDHYTTLHFGLSLNLEQAALDQSAFTDGASTDPAVNNGNESGIGVNANSGVILKINQTHMGVAISNMMGQTNKMFNDPSEPNGVMDFNFHIGTLVKMKSREIYFEPLVYYRRNLLKASKVDLNVKMTMPTPNPSLAFWGLLAYRRTMDEKYGNDLGFATAIGVTRGRLSAGLEYQLGLTSAQTNYGSAFQFVCRYRICHDKAAEAIACPKVQRDEDGGYKPKSGKYK